MLLILMPVFGTKASNNGSFIQLRLTSTFDINLSLLPPISGTCKANFPDEDKLHHFQLAVSPGKSRRKKTSWSVPYLNNCINNWITAFLHGMQKEMVTDNVKLASTTEMLILYTLIEAIYLVAFLLNLTHDNSLIQCSATDLIRFLLTSF